MCGIAGIVGDIASDTAHIVVKDMVCSLARRGPDGEGMESWPGAVLGHRRLAIFDLSDAGKQPMLSADRRVGVVFNGSIYNYRELREHLVSRGHTFHSDTDTEILINGYIEWGLDDLISRLRGMFAFGLWDDARHKLFLVRDRLGVKPLCYVVRGKTIAFASTPRALKRSGLLGRLNPVGILDFLSLGYVPDQSSAYEGVRKVAAATVIEWENGKLVEREYWRLPPVASQPRVSFDDAVEETERLFVDAVRSRLYAHVPVGALLSGGVDSALVCWAISQLGGRVTAFTVGVPGDPWDETIAARETARALGLNHEVLEIAEGGEAEAEKLAVAYPEPFAAASGLGMLRISQAAAEHVTVLLTGDGGDDVFLGYPRHRHLWMAGRIPHWIRRGLAGIWPHLSRGVPRQGAFRRVASFADYASGDLGAFFDHLRWLDDPQSRLLLGEQLMTKNLGGSEKSDMRVNGAEPLTPLLRHEYSSRFVGEYLTKVDGATMHHAIEARSPFLDQGLWEFAASLPYNLRLHRGTLKAILRKIAEKRIGADTAKRPKSGFSIPVHRWVTGRWRKQVQSAFENSILQDEGWINSRHALRLLNTPGLPKEYLDQLWRIYVLEIWMRKEHDTRMSDGSGAGGGSLSVSERTAMSKESN